MFLWQKLKYNLVFLEKDEDFKYLKNALLDMRPDIVAFDTETTGLHIIEDKPFLVGVGFLDRLYVYEPTVHRNKLLFDILKTVKPKYFLAHNAKFDYHMFMNFGNKIPEEINIGDTLSLARITDYVDSLGSISLEALGATFVDDDAKFASKVIKEHINKINKERYKKIKEYVYENIPDITYTKFKELYKDRVQFVDTPYDEHFKEIDKIAPMANYKDSYKENPNLMINYLADDVLLVLKVYENLIEILDKVDKNRKTWHRENKLVRVVGDMERTGMKADINYLLTQRKIVKKYIKETYIRLESLTGMSFTSGQHKVIKEMFENKYRIGMFATDEAALEEIIKYNDGDSKLVAKYILELRTLEKWLSTYINGMLNRIKGTRIYTDINNSGASTGRVSSDMQQQPKDPLLDKDGNELFHPRKVFINDDGYKNYYIDFSNMELRVQAYYTMITSGGDLNMCRAFMPFKCYNALTGQEFNPKTDLNKIDDNIWVYEDGSPWEKVDLHTATTLKAFPHIKEDDPDFKDVYRQMGKKANFLKNYGGGKKALITQLKVDDDTAEALNKGYYQAFPKVLDYQKWVDNQVRTYGYVENLFNRRYYFQNTSFSYRGYNYLIQGSCADYVKQKEIEVNDLLKGHDSKMVMPIHDEIIFNIKDGEEFLIPEIKKIMEDSREMMDTIPMVAEVSLTETNWAEKKEITI